LLAQKGINMSHVSVAEQLSLARKYGVPEELIQRVKNERQGQEEVATIFANALMQLMVEPDDVRSVNALVDSRFAMDPELYRAVYIARSNL
jgi:hypothetical protein